MGYNGYVRVLDANGYVLDLVEAQLAEVDHEGHRWGGTLKVAVGSGLAGKRLPVTIDLPGRFSAPALIGPTGLVEGPDTEVLEVLGNGPVPFN